MLSTPNVATNNENDSIFLTYTQLYEQIYGKGQIYETQDCPFLGEVAISLEMIEGLHDKPDIVSETLLLLLPVCVKHKQCIYCFQDPDEEFNGKGMRSLRLKVTNAASLLISHVYDSTTAADGFTPPFLASAKAFVCGCCLATAISKRWVASHAFMKDIIKCTEVLTHFAPHWKGGSKYLQVWRAVLSLLDFN
jgi:hypothetical protein